MSVFGFFLSPSVGLVPCLLVCDLFPEKSGTMGGNQDLKCKIPLTAHPLYTMLRS
jgi:hypothetical protein